MSYIDEKKVVLKKKPPLIQYPLPRGFFQGKDDQNIALQERQAYTESALTHPEQNMPEIKKEVEPEPMPLIRLPKCNFIPEGGKYFDKHALATVTGTGVIKIVSFQIPSGHEGYFKMFGQDCDSVIAWSTLTWYLTINDMPMQEYGVITRQLGTITEMTDVTMKLSEGDVVQLAAKISAGTAQCWGRIKGWYYPIPATHYKLFGN